MGLPLTAKTNGLGHLEIGGCDMVMLTKKYGTPLYVIDEVALRDKAKQYIESLKEFYPKSQVAYATKALSVVGLLRVLSEEGLGFDVSSGGEIFTAIKARVNMAKVYFHGNNKSREEVVMALDAGVGRIVVDSIEELFLLDEVTKGTGLKARVLLRINPGVEAHTHEHIKTGQLDSKFGIPKNKVLEAVIMADKMKFIEFMGLHAHIGSQILDTKGFLEEVSVLLEHSKGIKNKLKIDVQEINVGGGIGISYLGEKAVDIKKFIKEIAARVKSDSKKLGLNTPKLTLEPGRSIVGEAGITLYSAGNIKEIPGIRKYVAVDGGMGDNIRPSLYQAEYLVVVANKMNDKKKEKVTIAGRYCESGDILIKDVKLPKLKREDTVAFLCTGAYGYSMASNYNRVPRPAMVLVQNGKAKLLVKRERYDDLVRNDII